MTLRCSQVSNQDQYKVSPVTNQLRNQVWDSVWGHTTKQIRDPVWDQVWFPSEGRVWTLTGNQIREQVRVPL